LKVFGNNRYGSIKFIIGRPKLLTQERLDEPLLQDLQAITEEKGVKEEWSAATKITKAAMSAALCYC